MMWDNDALEREFAERVTRLGLEFVELERAGSKSRPILRVRIDRPGSEPGQGVSVADCARVSRELESCVDGFERADSRYVLEVSSPGVERPLIRRTDFERFAGREIAVLGRAVLAGRARRLEGELLGVTGAEPDESISLRLPGGEVVEIRRGDIERAHLVFRWP
jgi:ribosome maturation factor RimP